MQNWLWESFSNMPNGTSYNWDSNTNPNDPYAGTALAGMNADQITQAYRNKLLVIAILNLDSGVNYLLDCNRILLRILLDLELVS